ncbi:MAG: hypothetical protein K1Y36_13955, partial [Blastocatellia bacterium]|nr:hypothetical protein [Blastocatellia bacterium]
MSHPSSKPTSDRQDFQRRLQRIEVLVNAVETASDPRIRAAMLELMQTLLELHGTALERMLEIVFETGPAGRELIDRFGADHLTSGVLLLHGLHTLDLETR